MEHHQSNLPALPRWVTEGFDETPVAEHMKGDHIHVAVDVGVGNGVATVWTGVLIVAVTA